MYKYINRNINRLMYDTMHDAIHPSVSQINSVNCQNDKVPVKQKKPISVMVSTSAFLAYPPVLECGCESPLWLEF